MMKTDLLANQNYSSNQNGVHKNLQQQQLTSCLQQQQQIQQQNFFQQQQQNPITIPNENQYKQWKIQDFELGPLLGKGKFSEVFLSREKNSGFIVALKIMDKEFLQKYGLQEQIKREIILQKCMQHDNILQLYGYFHDEKKIYLILEYSEQGDLYTLMHQYKDKRLPEELAKQFIKQVIQALMFLHSHSVIHRDLKPENLLISNGTIKLADFGLATRHSLPGDLDLQNNNNMDSNHQVEKRKTFCGTLDYISPEMFLKKGHDHKIDIWSIGILIFELCAGHPPFESNTYDETMKKVVNCKNLSFPNIFSQTLKDILSQILIADPDKRPSFQYILDHQWFSEVENCQ